MKRDSCQNTKYQNALDHLVYGRFYQPEDAAEDLVCLAKGVWFDNYTPSLKQYSGQELQKAAYVTEFLAANHLVNSFRRGALRASLNAAKQRAEFPPAFTPFYLNDKANKFSGRDKLAKRWGFSSGLQASKVKQLLDLQRRANTEHYQAAV